MSLKLDHGTHPRLAVDTNRGLQRKPVSLADVLKDVIGSLEKSDLRKCGTIFIHWPEIVGERIAQHTQPDRVRGKKLRVLVDSSDWLYEITSNFGRQILEDVQSWVGKETIQEICYRVGEVE